jgi:hypothetical protein
MSSATISNPYCASCGKELNELPNISPNQRKPCPACGSFNRKFLVSIIETMEIHESLGMKGKHAGITRPFIETFSGAQWSYKLKNWIDKIRTIDRDIDLYEEKITDPNSRTVLHHVKEKLSSHTGHGSAKKVNKSTII